MTAIDCTWHYYNRSAAMGWVFGETLFVYDHASVQLYTLRIVYDINTKRWLDAAVIVLINFPVPSAMHHFINVNI